MTQEQGNIHTLLFSVRDYECDMQGIVNNSVYQNYLEHARHTFIKTKGLDFAEITRQGIHLVLMRAEVDYKRSLKSGDEFIVETHAERTSKFKFVFHQKIFSTDKATTFLMAKMTIASITDKGKPIVFEDADKLLT